MKFVLIIIFLFVLHETKAFPATQDLLRNAHTLSGRYLNYSCSLQKDSVLELCRNAEQWATTHHDLYGKFKIRQLAVNALCLQGDIGLGINMAGNMYKEARQRNNPLSIALSLQSMGAAYMHAGMYQQAAGTFSEAEILMNSSGDTLSRLQLAMQQMHNAMLLEDMPRLIDHLNTAAALINHLDPAEKEDYLFYILCYKTVLQIQYKSHEKAGQYIKAMQIAQPADGFFERWKYSLLARYHEMRADHATALAYCDSTLWAIRQRGNMNEYAGSMTEKALLLEAMGRKEEACQMYDQINQLTDSLNIPRYVRQIDALRMNYQVDQMELKNLAEHNTLLMTTLIYSIGLCLVILIFIFIARRKNNRLIQERKKLAIMRAAAADSIQSKSIFLSNMSHDLRTPLNAIVGFSRILTETDVDLEMKQQCRDHIRQNSALLIKLVNDIVGFSDLKGAKIRFNYKKCEVVRLCRSVVETVGNVKRTPATLSFCSDLPELEIETDSERLQQVLINLLVNATKFTQEGAIRLILCLNEKQQEAVFTVEDTGCGIPEEKQERIFERFEKLHDTVQGVGLGLSICKIIVEHVGGKIWLDTTYTKGARFVFTHPICRHHGSK